MGRPVLECAPSTSSALLIARGVLPSAATARARGLLDDEGGRLCTLHVPPGPSGSGCVSLVRAAPAASTEWGPFSYGNGGSMLVGAAGSLFSMRSAKICRARVGSGLPALV